MSTLDEAGRNSEKRLPSTLNFYIPLVSPYPFSCTPRRVSDPGDGKDSTGPERWQEGLHLVVSRPTSPVRVLTFLFSGPRSEE